MLLWCEWWNGWRRCERRAPGNRTFMWMCVALAGFCVRPDLWGVTSFRAGAGLQAACYDRLLDFFHSPALDVDALTRLWRRWWRGSIRTS